MRDVLDTLLTGWQNGETAGLATVVRTFQSAPRPPGASMVVSVDGTVAGSVSGGCVESAVYELATQVAQDGVPVLVRYGISDDDAFAVGLTCGGILDVFVEPVSRETFALLEGVRDDIDAGRPVGVATVIEHPDSRLLGRHLIVRPNGFEGDLGSDRANGAIGDDTRGLLAAGRQTTLTYGPDGERRGEGMRVFFAGYAPTPNARVRGHRLRHRTRPAGHLPRLSGDRLRCAACSPPPPAFPVLTRSWCPGPTATFERKSPPAGSINAP